MNQEMYERVKEAAKYKKMAIRALLPEKAAGHIDVIEGEINAMFMEFMMDVVKEQMTHPFNDSHSSDSTVTSTREITIS